MSEENKSEKTEEKKRVKVKDSLLKMTDMEFTSHLKGEKEAVINLELQVCGEDANTLIALANLTSDETYLDDLLNIIFKSGLLYCSEQQKIMKFKNIITPDSLGKGFKIDGQ